MMPATWMPATWNSYQYALGRHVTAIIPSPFEEWELITFSGFVKGVQCGFCGVFYYDIDGDTPASAIGQTTILSISGIAEWFVWPIENPLKYLALNGRLVLES